MSRQELEPLSKAELIEIIMQLQAPIAALEERVNRLTQPPKDASNSSVPPSQTRKPNRPRSYPPSKRGPRPSHEGRSSRRDKPDSVIETPCRQTRPPAATPAGSRIGITKTAGPCSPFCIVLTCHPTTTPASARCAGRWSIGK